MGRGERVLPGVWRLRLPLDLPGVPHVNAWALKAGDGIVLVDTGMHDRGTMAHLEQALDRTGHRVSDIQLIVVTHAHIDHCGQAPPLAERAGCEVWMHPNWQLHAHEDLDKSIDIALLSGVPEEPLRQWAEARRGMGTGQAGELYSDKDLVPGVNAVYEGRKSAPAGIWPGLNRLHDRPPGPDPIPEAPHRSASVVFDHVLVTGVNGNCTSQRRP